MTERDLAPGWMALARFCHSSGPGRGGSLLAVGPGSRLFHAELARSRLTGHRLFGYRGDCAVSRRRDRYAPDPPRRRRTPRNQAGRQTKVGLGCRPVDGGRRDLGVPAAVAVAVDLVGLAEAVHDAGPRNVERQCGSPHRAGQRQARPSAGASLARSWSCRCSRWTARRRSENRLALLSGS